MLVWEGLFLLRFLLRFLYTSFVVFQLLLGGSGGFGL